MLGCVRRACRLDVIGGVCCCLPSLWLLKCIIGGATFSTFTFYTFYFFCYFVCFSPSFFSFLLRLSLHIIDLLHLSSSSFSPGFPYSLEFGSLSLYVIFGHCLLRAGFLNDLRVISTMVDFQKYCCLCGAPLHAPEDPYSEQSREDYLDDLLPEELDHRIPEFGYDPLVIEEQGM